MPTPPVQDTTLNTFLFFLVRVGVTAAIVAAAWGCGEMARRAVQRMGKLRNIEASLVRLFGQVAFFTAMAVGGIMALANLGINVSALMASLGLIGLAVGLALKEIISNVFAGIMVILYKPFKENDHIAVTTFEGRVSEINLRYTTLEAGQQRIFVPNALVISNAVVVDTAAPGAPPPPAKVQELR